MTLFAATFITGLILIAWGLPFLKGGEKVRSQAFALLRSQPAAIVLFGAASVWFLFHITQLGPADFGNWKNILLAIFGVTAVGAFFFTPDFLPVRGLAGLILLGAGPVLGAAYMRYEEPQRLLLVTVVYILVIAAMFIGTMPYLMRNLFEWLWAQPKRLKAFGVSFVATGAALVIISFTY